jgi:RNA recognition motif-containing protein
MVESEDFDLASVPTTLDAPQKQKRSIAYVSKDEFVETKKKKKSTKAAKDSVKTEETKGETEDETAPAENVESKDAPAKKRPKLKKGENGIWVGNLRFSTTKQMLSRLFHPCGEMVRLHLPMKNKTDNKG